MMKRMFFLVAIVFVTSISVNAQDDPKVEVWGTYSLFIADIDVINNESLHGFGLGIQGNFNKNVGIVAEKEWQRFIDVMV